jgi:iron complex outermembrane receptor protein
MKTGTNDSDCTSRSWHKAVGCDGQRVLRHGYPGLLIAVFLAIPAWPQQKPMDLANASIEDLMNIEVTSVSKKEQKLSQSAAAVYVITEEDIRRSGMTTVPDLLRMVPGLQVAHIDASEWAVTARGFNARFADKLLVLIDGRSLYSPSLSGVYWEVQDLMLEDIGRIEVIRGPGATLWGPGAVNGVVNIITKKSKDTQGGLAIAGGGVQERGIAGVRYGGQMGRDGYYRIYASGFDRGPFAKGLGAAPDDGWHVFRGGFRTDWQLSNRDAFTIEGDAYQGDNHQLTDSALLTPPFFVEAVSQTAVSGGDLFARWTRTYSAQSDMSLQVYYEGDNRNDRVLGAFAQSLDFDFQHRFRFSTRHDIIWGLGYRRTQSTFANTLQTSFLPPSQGGSLFSEFVQDEIALVPDRLHFVAGIRFENAPYTGFNAQPSGRLLWALAKAQTIWTAVSAARRTADRADRGLDSLLATFPGPGESVAALTLLGDANTRNENVLAFELGYRIQPVERLSFDMAAFYNHYSHLNTTEPGNPFFVTDPAPAHLVIPLFFSNQMHGQTYGAEFSTVWKVMNTWKLDVSYTFLRLALHPDASSQDVSAAAQVAGGSPRNQVQLRSQWNLPHNFEFDQSAYVVGKLVTQPVPAYTRLDVRLGWRPTEATEFSVAGQNLLSPRHLEFIDSAADISTQDIRKVFAKFTWRF